MDQNQILTDKEVKKKEKKLKADLKNKGKITTETPPFLEEKRKAKKGGGLEIFLFPYWSKW